MSSSTTPETATSRRAPLVPGAPLLGSATAIGRDLRGFLFENYRRLGPIFRVRALGMSFTVLAGPEATQWVTRHGAAHLRSEKIWGGMDHEHGAQRSLISMDGPDHARMRAVQKSGYQRAVIEQHLDDVVASIARDVRAWPGGEARVAHPTLQRMVTRQLGEMITGVSPGEYIEDLVHFVRTALLTHVTKQRPPFMRWLPRYRRAKARVHELGRKVIEQHAPTAHTRSGNLVDDLINLSREDPGFLPSTDVLIGALGPFIAGLDTVASTTGFILYVLLTHPELRERIVAEVDTLFESGPLTAAGLRQLDVLHRTIMETMRLYPIAPAITRTVAEPFEFGGYTVEQGAQVILGTGVALGMEEFYPNPERFDIDRYLPERNEHRKPGAYTPFGAGPHICLGAGFAEVHLMIFTAALLRHARIEMDPADYQLRIDPAPTPHPDKGFRIRLTPRSEV